MEGRWWIGATDQAPVSPAERVFVWMSSGTLIPTSSITDSHMSAEYSALNDADASFSMWGVGQPDNWPNQVDIFDYIYQQSHTLIYLSSFPTSQPKSIF